jgi:hypothetical protein
MSRFVALPAEGADFPDIADVLWRTFAFEHPLIHNTYPGYLVLHPTSFHFADSNSVHTASRHPKGEP